LTIFFISPYKPIDDPEKCALRIASDLKIDPKYYRRQLFKDWPMVQFIRTSNIASLQWIIRIPSAEGFVEGTIGMLHQNLQVVSFDTPYEPFFLWHRQIVDSRHRLYLSNSSSMDYMELKPDVTVEEIRQFISGSDAS
jgi:hypothetical protein